MSYDHVHDRIEKEQWEMPEWMEQHFIDLFSGYPKHEIERHVNAGDEVTVFNNAPLALQCVASKTKVSVLEHIWKRGIFVQPTFDKGQEVLAFNKRKATPKLEEAVVIDVTTKWDDNKMPTHVYTIEFKRLRGVKNRRLTLDESQIEHTKGEES